MTEMRSPSLGGPIDDPKFQVCLRPGGTPTPGRALGLLEQFRADPPLRAEALWNGLAAVLRPLQAAAAYALPRDLNLVAQPGAAANVSLLYALVSGILMLFWYSPSVHEAHASLAASAPYSLGRIMQGLHRYSSDACMLFVFLHAIQVMAARAVTGARWLAWVTGILLLGLLWFDGWTGYWLAWDDSAARIAITSARWLDIIPIFAEPLSRTFLADATVTSLHFFLVFFIHMLIPLAMGVALWLHIARLNRSRFLTSGRAAAALGLFFVLLAIAAPAVPGPAATLSRDPATVRMDWFYMAPLVVMERVTPMTGWALASVLVSFALGLPWILARRRAAPVTVVEDRCNGCRQCVVDCPYAAITMNLRPDAPFVTATSSAAATAASTSASAAASATANSAPATTATSPVLRAAVFATENPVGEPDPLRRAVIDPALCVGCGICVGSCAPAAIDFRHLPVTAVRERMARWLTDSRLWVSHPSGGAPRSKAWAPPDALAFLCTHGAASSLAFDPANGISPELPGYRIVPVPCTGWVHPYLLRRAFKEGYSAVLVGGCSTMPIYREGVERTDERLDGDDAVPTGRVLRLRFDRADRASFLEEAEAFRKAHVTSTGATQPQREATGSERSRSDVPFAGARRWILAALLVVALAVGVVAPSEGVVAVPGAGASSLVVSFRLAGMPGHVAAHVADPELMPHMQGGVQASARDRVPVRLRVRVDGATVLENAYPAHGLFGDGASIAIERVPLTPGAHEVEVALGVTTDPSEWTHRATRTLEVTEGRRAAVLFDAVDGFQWH